MTELIRKLFSPRALAEILSVSVQSIRRFERDGKLRGIRVGGVLRFPESEILKFLDECEKKPRRVPPAGLLENGGRPRRKRK